MPDQIQCPHCGQVYQLTPEQVPQYAGRTITCTQCQKPFTVPGEHVAASPPPPAATPAQPTMPYEQAERPGVPPPMPAMPVGYAGPRTYERQESNGWAVASLVCACAGFVVPVIPTILGVVFGIIGLKKAKDPRVGGKGMAIAGICVSAFSILAGVCMISVLLPSLNRARETANRVKCASNMRQIGQAILLYSNDNRGAYPDTLEQLLTTQDITSEVFVCPTSTDTPSSPGGTPQQQAASLSSGGHLSYVYVGKGSTNQASADTVILYEKPGNHGTGSAADGMNILWGDGHVSWEGGKYSQFIIKEVNAGHNPPRPYNGQ
jgi:predicted Zn finger-like uncharacterized protein/prepilin-type processing-associated H-X9-DG protein